MALLLNVLIAIIIFCCILLVVSILLQEDKSGGGIGIVGGSSQSFFGASSGSILSRFTAILLTIFVVLTVIIALIASSFTRQSVITETDIERTELEEYEIEYNRSFLKELPNIIPEGIFSSDIIGKLSEDDKIEKVKKFYKLNNGVYKLEKNISSTEEKELLSIFNSVDFSLEAKTTVVSDSTTDK